MLLAAGGQGGVTDSPLRDLHLDRPGASHRQYHHVLSVLFSQVLFLKQEFTGCLLRNKRCFDTANCTIQTGERRLRFPLRYNLFPMLPSDTVLRIADSSPSYLHCEDNSVKQMGKLRH